MACLIAADTKKKTSLRLLVIRFVADIAVHYGKIGNTFDSHA